MINHIRAMTLAAFAIIFLSACGNSETPSIPDALPPTESVTEPETLARADVPVFPEDDIDWDSLRFKVDLDERAETLRNNPEAFTPNYSRTQWEALDEEGKVTREDYEAAFYRFKTCVEENGAQLNYVSEIGDEFDYTFYDIYKETVDACYEYHYWLLDAAWQVNLPPKDETYQITSYIKCLEENGLTPVHTEPITEVGEAQQTQLMELFDQVFEHADQCL